VDGSNWLRLGAIAGLLLAALYVLAPTWLKPEVVDQAALDAVVTVAAEPPLQAWYVTADGDVPSEAMAAAAEARVKAAGLGVERAAIEGGKLVVYLRSGVRKADIDAVLAVSAAPLAALGLDEAALADAAALQAALEALPPGSWPAGAASAVVEVRDGALVLSEVGALEPGQVAIAVDALPVGLAAAAEAGATVALLPNAPAASTALLATPPLPAPVVRWTAPEQPAAPAPEASAAAEPPPWYANLLPDTALNLGLDLQGGLDLTLQVDLEAAVFAQVQRDRQAFGDQALRDDLPLTFARDKTRAALKVSGASFDAARTFLGEASTDYVYLESVDEGGTTVHVFGLRDERVAQIEDQAVEQVLETLRKRVDSTGVKEPAIVKMGGGRINIQLPGVTGIEAATDAIGTQAVLEFRLVDSETDPTTISRWVATAERELPEDQLADDDLLNDWLRGQSLLPEGRRLMWEYEETSPKVFERTVPVLVHDQVLLTGGDLNNASVAFDQSNQAQVILDFKPRGASIFCDVTTEHVKEQFAIILDDQVRSAPSIREPICGGRASIEMGGSADSAKDANTLALVLRTGSLTAPVDIGEVRQIGASLGADAIRSGVQGSLIGGLLTVLFMGLYYRTPGFIADVALALNVLLVFALLAIFGATLTLPGIAGVALTIGMAVDANIIIFERIREELNLGALPRKAVDVGYEKALSAVLDANITTGIAGVVLYSYGSGPIKGFAVTLLIGIFTTLVTALFVTRTFMEVLTRNSTARLRI
jgi:preprotein translocase subunit SecD